MLEEQPVRGLNVANCSGCTGEPSSASSPVPLPVMAEIHLVCAGQCALHCGHRGQPLTRYMVPGSSIFEQQSLSSEGGHPRTSRGCSSSNSAKDRESRLSGGIAQAWSA